jgi:hypothetical protein
MECKKISERVTRFENYSGYFMIREFQYESPSLNPISEFIKTPFICWKEEYRNEVQVSINNAIHTVDWNFHGLYDLKKLRAEHFVKIRGQELADRFKEFVRSEVGVDKMHLGFEQLLDELCASTNSDYFLITEMEASFQHEWTVFDFFLSGFKISRDTLTITAIECEMD